MKFMHHLSVPRTSLFGRARWLIGFSLLLIPALGLQYPSPASADTLSCGSRQLGERCSARYEADAGKSGSTSDPKDTGVLTRQVPNGYAVLGYREQNLSSNGGTFTIQYLSSEGSTSLISQASSDFRRLEEIKNNLDILARVPSESGQSQEFRARVDQLTRDLYAVQSAISTVINANSNVDTFILQAKSKYVCTRKALGVCLDGYGNHGKGYVDVQLVYLGGSSDKVQRIAAQYEQLRLQGNSSGSQNSNRTRFRYSTGSFIDRGGGNWIEVRDNGPSSRFVETQRNSSYIEMYDSSRGLRVRLYNDRALGNHGSSGTWVQWPGSNGNWGN